MIRGEGDLAHERWFVPGIPPGGAEGQVAIKAARNIKPGTWLADVRFSIGSQAVEALSYEMPADERLVDLTVKPLTQDNQECADDFSISLRPGGSKTHVQNMAEVVAGRGNVKVVRGLEILSAPGQYLVDLLIQSAEQLVPAVYSTLTVTRPMGKLAHVQLKGPSKLCTQSQKQFVLSVSASTSLGAQLAPDIWQGDLTFLATDAHGVCRLELNIVLDTRPNPNAATTSAYLISLDDDGGIDEDIMVDTWARVGVQEIDEHGASSRVEVDSNVIEQFRYAPQAQIQRAGSEPL